MLNPNKVQSDRRYGLSRAGPRALDLCFSELRFCINTVPGSASILMKKPKITHFWNSHSLLSRGHTCLVFSQREMQWKWNACCRTKNTKLYYNRTDTVHILISFDWLVDVCVIKLTLQTPQATVHSSDVADAWLAWHSIPEGRWTGLKQPRQLTK